MSEKLSAFIAVESDAGKRLDQFLTERVLELGRKRAAELCALGHVRVDGKRAKKSTQLAAGATVTVELAEIGEVEAEPELPLAVRLERPELVLVSKPAGMPSAPLKLSERGTLCNALVARYPEMRAVGHRAREPGLVHRLDTQTSGLVLAARSAEAFTRLARALELETLHKRYLALVTPDDLPDHGEISRALAPDSAHPERVRVLDAGDFSGYARQKTTKYRVLQRSAGRALLEVEIGSAFRHQIRAHLASLGYPIVGDAVYGGRAVAALGARHALHASELSWAGDDASAGFSCREPLPPELASLLEA